MIKLAEFFDFKMNFTIVAVIEGVEGNKEILVSLKLIKMWGIVHDTFPKERVENFFKRMNEENKYDSTYLSYYSIDTSTSHSLPPPSKQCELLKKKILSNWGFNKNNYGRISSGRVLSSKCNSSTNSTMG